MIGDCCFGIYGTDLPTRMSTPVVFTWTVVPLPAPVLLNPGSQVTVAFAHVALPLVATTLGPYPLTYAASGLPPGLAVDRATGVISGTSPGWSDAVYQVTAFVTDGRLVSSQAFSWTVQAVPVTVHPLTLPPPLTDQPYRQTITATGGATNGPFTFTVVSGTLPPGLTLSSAGELTGTVAGTPSLRPTSWPDGRVDTRYGLQAVVLETVPVGQHFAFTVSATDGFGRTGRQAYGIRVESGWASAAFDAATLFKCVRIAADGTVSGTPVTTATFTFTVVARNTAGVTIAWPVTVTVTPA